MALPVVGGIEPGVGGGVFVVTSPVTPTIVNMEPSNQASAPASRWNSVWRAPEAVIGAAMLPLTCQPASTRSVFVSRPPSAHGGSLSSGGRAGGRFAPLRTTVSCGGLCGDGMRISTLPGGDCQVRAACTKAVIDAPTSAALVPKNVGI